MLKLVYICMKENSFYTEAKIMDNEDMNRVYDYLRKNRKRLSIKAHTNNPVFVNEEGVDLNGLVLLAEEEVDKVILVHYKGRYSCGTRALHHELSKKNSLVIHVFASKTMFYLDQIYNEISETRITKVIKASSACGQMH